MKHTARLCLTLLPVLVMLLHAGGWWRLEALERLEAMVYDMRLRAFMPRTLDERIAIVDLDEKSLAEVGQWPWSRHHLARLMDTLFEQQQIAALGMDVVFAEADASSGLVQLQALAAGALRDQPGFAQQLAALAPLVDSDQRFAQALQNRPVVLGYYFKHDATARHSGNLPAPVLQQQALGERRFAVKVKGKNEAVQIYTVRGTPDDLTPLLRDELAQWASFLQAWQAQQWVQAGALIRALAQQHPQQLLYALYQERVAARSAQPFDPGWDGSTQFETK